MTVVMGKRRVARPRLAALFIAIAACAEAPPPLPMAPRSWTAETPGVVERADAGPASERDGWLPGALRAGVPVSDRTALAVIGEDLVAFDRATFARSIVAPAIGPGRCVGMRTATDALFVCTGDPRACFDCGGGCPGGVCNARVLRVPIAGPFVPREELLAEFAQFWASDDGSLINVDTRGCWGHSKRQNVYGHWSDDVCVRSVDGVWRHNRVDAGPGFPDGPDPGAGMGPSPPRRFRAVRWIARGDGAAVAVVKGIDGDPDAWGLAYPEDDRVVRWPNGPESRDVREALSASESDMQTSPVEGDDPSPLNRSWSLTARNTLRGWAKMAGDWHAVEVSWDGAVTLLGPAFNRILHAGPVALGAMKDGSTWQTVDHGTHWTRVTDAAVRLPESCGQAGCNYELSCSLLGCAIGSWYRIGWNPAGLDGP